MKREEEERESESENPTILEWTDGVLSPRTKKIFHLQLTIPLVVFYDRQLHVVVIFFPKRDT